MNHIGYYFDKSIIIDISSIIDFVLSYKMVMVLLVYFFCVYIAFWAINLVTFVLLMLFYLIPITEKETLKALSILSLVKLRNDTYFFKDNASRNVIFELYQDMNEFTIKSEIFIKLKLFVSILLVSHFIFSFYNLEYCFPTYVVFWVNSVKNVGIIISFILLLGMVTIERKIEKVYFDLVRNEFKKKA